MFFLGMSVLFARINGALFCVAKPMFDFMVKTRSYIERDPVCRMFNQNNASLCPSMTTLINRQTPLHRDMNNHMKGLEFLTTAGRFTGGDFEMPELGLEAWYEPGSFFIFRGRVFAHRVGPWKASPADKLRGILRGIRLCFSQYNQRAVVEVMQRIFPLGAVPDLPFTRVLPFLYDHTVKKVISNPLFNA